MLATPTKSALTFPAAATDVIRKEKRTTANDVVVDLGSLRVIGDQVDSAEACSVQQEIALLPDAIHALPRRCREIMIMCKLERRSHQEIARRLGISQSTVEVQLYRAMEKFTRYLRSRGVVISPRGGQS